MTISKIGFYCLIFVTVGSIFFTFPFLHYPYDVFAHLIAIDEMYHGFSETTTSIQHSRLLWHSIWANIFHILDIDSIDMLRRAKIIHVIQTLLASFFVYYFSHVVIRNLFKEIPQLIARYLSLWSVWIWFSIFATYSVAYHQVWNMWYSVNYQITLPLFFYIFGLTLVLFLEQTSRLKKIFFSIQIILIGKFILQVHAMEFMYYLMYILVFIIIYLDKVWKIVKKHYVYVALFLSTMIYGIAQILPEKSKIFYYLHIEKLSDLYAGILSNGNILIGGYNRAYVVMNELIYVLLFLIVWMSLHMIWKWFQKESIGISLRLWIFVVITSFFIAIPLYQFSSGLFAMITRANVVHRLYFSASLFVVLPVFSYYFFQKYTLKYINTLIVIVLFSVYVISQYTSLYFHNYYQNIQSILYSFDREKVGFHLTEKEITWIGEQLNIYENKYKGNRPLYYDARADVAFVIKYMYGRKVYWRGRRKWLDYKKDYQQNISNKNYKHILFEIPKDFSKYKPYM